MNATKRSLCKKHSKTNNKRVITRKIFKNDEQLTQLQIENESLRKLLDTYFSDNISKDETVQKLQQTIDTLKDALENIKLEVIVEEDEEGNEDEYYEETAAPSTRAPTAPPEVLKLDKVQDKSGIRRARSVDRQQLPKPRVVRRASSTTHRPSPKPVPRPSPRPPKPVRRSVTTVNQPPIARRATHPIRRPAEVPRLKLQRRTTPTSIIKQKEPPLVKKNRPKPLVRKSTACPIMSPRR